MIPNVVYNLNNCYDCYKYSNNPPLQNIKIGDSVNGWSIEDIEDFNFMRGSNRVIYHNHSPITRTLDENLIVKCYSNIHYFEINKYIPNDMGFVESFRIKSKRDILFGSHCGNCFFNLCDEDWYYAQYNHRGLVMMSDSANVVLDWSFDKEIEYIIEILNLTPEREFGVKLKYVGREWCNWCKFL